jgi:hypothetical protein
MSVSAPSSGTGKPEPFARELIEKEIEHLKNRRGVRHAQETPRAWGKIIACLVVLAVLWFYSMDAFLFSYARGDAIHVYLYLHNYGSDAKAHVMAASGLLTDNEVQQLNHRTGSFQDYFTGTGPAEQRAVELIAYMDQVHALQEGNYDALSPLNKVRYFLFVKTGLTPPIHWPFLDSPLDR